MSTNPFRRDIISISRLPGNLSDGAQDYARSDPANATVIYSDIPADIQKKMESRKPAAALPGDVVDSYFYEIFIPATALARNTIFNRDYITDQSGKIYQVNTDYWTVFGYQLICELLQI